MKLRYLDVGDPAVHTREIAFCFDDDDKKVMFCQIFGKGQSPTLVANKLEALAASIRELDRERL